MRLAYEQREVLQALLILVEIRMFATQSEDIGLHKTELVAVIRSQLGQTHLLQINQRDIARVKTVLTEKAGN